MRRLVLLPGVLALALTLTPGAARAADYGNSVEGWTGWYIGLQLGTNRNSYDGFGTDNAFSQELTGGYNYQINSYFVVGADLYTDWNSDTSHSVNSSPGVSADFGSRGFGAEAMAGFVVRNFLPYVKVGYGRLSLSGDLSGQDNSARFGAGFLWRINSNSGLLLQYTYQKVNIPNIQGNGDFKNSNIMVGYNWYF